MTQLLLLPGMTLNTTIFPDFAFSAQGVDFNDAPPPNHEVAGMGAYVTELDKRVEALTGWMDSEPRIVVAHSFGGMLALRWLLAAAPAARSVDRLLLIATTAGPMYDAVSLRLGRLGDREFRIGINQLMSVWNRPFVTRTVKRAMTHGSLDVEQVDFRALPNPTDLAVDFAGWRNTDWQAMRAYRNAMAGYDVRHQLTAISLPTIVLHGSDDAIFDPSAARFLAASLPNAKLRIIEGARHALPLTHGEAVCDAVNDLAH